MKKTVLLICLMGFALYLAGCANTVEGVKKDSQDNWKTLKTWDQKFREKWW